MKTIDAYAVELDRLFMSFPAIDDAGRALFRDMESYTSIHPLGLQIEPGNLRILIFNVFYQAGQVGKFATRVQYLVSNIETALDSRQLEPIKRELGEILLRSAKELYNEVQGMLRAYQSAAPQLVANLAIPTGMTGAPRTLRDDPTRNPSGQGELFSEEEDTRRHFRDSFRRPSDPSDVIPWQEVDFFYNRNDYSSTLARYKGKRVRMPNGIRRFTKQTLRDIIRMDPE